MKILNNEKSIRAQGCTLYTYVYTMCALKYHFCSLGSCDSQQSSKIFVLTGKDNIVKMIIDNKPDMINVKNDDGKTPLIIAAEYSGELP